MTPRGRPFASAALVLIVFGIVAIPSSAAGQDIACDQFDVGSKAWSDCLDEYVESQFDKSRDAQQEENARNGIACAEFDVGSPQWTDCVEDAATGGGLMPWIVIVPLGVMVVGMGAMFAWQFSGRGMAARNRNPLRVGAVWMFFIGLLEAGMGGAFFVAWSRSESAGFLAAAVPLTAVGVIMVVVGIVMQRAGARKDRVLSQGMPGRARVINVHETGMVVNNIPRLAFELELNTATAAGQRVTVRSSPPILALSRLYAGMELPVKVDMNDPSHIEIDWEAWVVESAANNDGPPDGYSGFGVQPDYSSS